MFNDFDHLSFSAWAAMTYAHKLFEKHSKETTGLLNLAEFNEILS